MSLDSAMDLPQTLPAFRGHHQGATIIVCGCGPSLNGLYHPERFITIGVNDVGRLFQPDYLVVLGASDAFTEGRFRYVAESRAKAIFTSNRNLGIAHARIVDVKIGRRGGTDFSDPAVLPGSNTSPYVAFCLAVHMGATKIGLIGVDFTDGHFFGETGPHVLAPTLPRVNQEFSDLYEVLRERGVQCFNLSQNSLFTAFPKISLEEFASAGVSIPAISNSCAECSIRPSLADLQQPGGAEMDSWFFRRVEQLMDLERFACASAAPLRLLSAPCSTGEEPYSMAIVLLEAGIRDFTIDAVDISLDAIQYAKRGVYPPNAFSEPIVPASWLGEYFSPNGCGFEPISEVRAKVSFRQANLLEPGALDGTYDIIFCRHLLHYLCAEADKLRVVSAMARALRARGVLFPGMDELVLFLLAGAEEIPGWRSSACRHPYASKATLPETHYLLDAQFWDHQRSLSEMDTFSRSAAARPLSEAESGKTAPADNREAHRAVHLKPGEMGITLVTPTGDRPEAFALVERWMARQTFSGPIQWIVADDGQVPTLCTMGQTVIRPKPWQPGQNTQFRNILAILPLIQFSKILHIEDDDWYAPTYVETMAARLDEAALVGEFPTRYYNVRYRTHYTCGNDQHASLFQTGMGREALVFLRFLCEREIWIDLALWPLIRNKRLFRGGEAVGIKGMPGRAGQVRAHGSVKWMDADPDFAVLRSWIGEDVECYRRFSNPASPISAVDAAEGRGGWIPGAGVGPVGGN